MSNLLKRTLFGGLFLLVMLAAMLIDQYVFLGIMLLFLIFMMREFLRMTMQDRYRFSQLLAILAGVFMFVLSFLYMDGLCPKKYGLLVLLPIFIVMINSLYVKDKAEFGKFANLYTALLYIAVPWSVFNMAVFPDPENLGQFNGLFLLSLFLVVWASDVGAYLFGITLGQKYGKKLFPSVSPKKSWVGFWGGFFLAIVVAVCLYYLGFWNMSLLHCILLAAVMNVSGVYGDLIESQWKRHYCIKDSGHSLPGHGGMLDRFDSALLSIPTALIYLHLFDLMPACCN